MRGGPRCWRCRRLLELTTTQSGEVREDCPPCRKQFAWLDERRKKQRARERRYYFRHHEERKAARKARYERCKAFERARSAAYRKTYRDAINARRRAKDAARRAAR